MCRLCGPLEPVALCPRCALKTTLEFEEPGESTLARAFYVTARDAVGSPSRMAERLGGSGHVLSALSFVTIAALLGLVPLSLILAAPLLSVADAVRLGLRSTGVLSVGVFVVLLAVALATLLSLSVLVFASWVRMAARITGIRVRSDVVLRATAYGLSLLALPVLGPVLLPLAFAQALLATHRALAIRGDSVRAALTLLIARAIGLAELGLFALLMTTVLA